MQIDDIKGLMDICSQSGFDYLKYSTDGYEVVFSKAKYFNSGAEIQREILGSELFYEEKTDSGNPKAKEGLLEKPQDKITEAKVPTQFNTLTIVSNYVGIIHLGDLFKEQENEIHINQGDFLCDIEAMKMYNKISSTVKGQIQEILVQNGDMIEYGQELFKVRVKEDD